MSQEEGPSSVAPRLLRSDRGKNRVRRRTSHFTVAKQRKVSKEKKENRTLCQIVELDCSSDESAQLRVKSLEDILKVIILL